MKKRTIVILLVISVLSAIGLTVFEIIRECDRLGLIRATKDLAIPEWLKLWIWGWR